MVAVPARRADCAPSILTSACDDPATVVSQLDRMTPRGQGWAISTGLAVTTTLRLLIDNLSHPDDASVALGKSMFLPGAIRWSPQEFGAALRASDVCEAVAIGPALKSRPLERGVEARWIS